MLALSKRSGAVACGLVSAGACLAVFAMLSDDQVEGAYDGGDLTIGIFGAPLVAGLAALVIAVMCRSRHWFGRPERLMQTLMPVVIWLIALLGIAAAGGERNNAETGALWAVAAFLAHLLVAAVTRTEGSPGRLSFCLPGGGVLVMAPGSLSGGIEGLLPSVRLRKLDAGDLASYPDGGAEHEAD